MRWRPVVVLLLLVPLAGCAQPAQNAWAVNVTELDELQGDHRQGKGVRVAILDSGIDADHPSLRHLASELEYVDFLGGPPQPMDRGGHGTFLASVLAGRSPSGTTSWTQADSSIQGIAPGVQLYVGRVCDRQDCSLEALWRGLEWAVENEVDIISLSLGFSSADLATHWGPHEEILDVLQLAETRGILVVAAAGNTDGSQVLFPARVPTVVAVGAMDRDGQPRASTARGYGSSKPDLIAPGQDIVGALRGGGRVTYHGTSAAVLFVVGAAALMMARYDPVDSELLGGLRSALVDNARPLPGQRQPHDPWAGHGLLQANAAWEAYQDFAVTYYARSRAGGPASG